MCGFAEGLAGESGFAVAGLAGACGQFAVQGAGVALLCGEAPAGSGGCAEADSPAVKKTNAKAKILGRSEEILLTHSQSHFTACWRRHDGESSLVTVNDISTFEMKSRSFATRLSVPCELIRGTQLHSPEDGGRVGLACRQGQYRFSIHAKHVEGVNEIRPGIATPIGHANVKSYWSRSSSRNLEGVVGLLNVGCSW